MPSTRNIPDKFRSRLLSALLILALAPMARAEIRIVLKREFIDKFKNRATIDASFTVDKAGTGAKSVGSGSQDGDMHNAGRSDDVQLPMVAEIMNARLQTGTIKVMKDAEGSDAVKISGVWRFWCEHGGSGDQIQGADVSPAEDTNPDHVFEIHPITKVNDTSLLSSFVPITSKSGKEFQYKDASDAFQRYENLKSHIEPGRDGTVAISTNMAGFNYVEFQIKPLESPVHIEDGSMVMAAVLDLTGDMIVRRRRMVFVGGSAPEKALLALKKGGVLHVIGIPRFDLSLVAWRVDHQSDRPESLDWTLPYEMVIVATKSAVRDSE